MGTRSRAERPGHGPTSRDGNAPVWIEGAAILSPMEPLHVVPLRQEAPPAPSAPPPQANPGDVIRVCANCGLAMEERKCKLLCRGCGYFLSCSDYY